MSLTAGEICLADMSLVVGFIVVIRIGEIVEQQIEGQCL
jgi:hypothetical protein